MTRDGVARDRDDNADRITLSAMSVAELYADVRGAADDRERHALAEV